MSIWGTLIGGMLGFTIGGPIGALLGSFLGSKFSGGKVKSINFSNENSQQIFALALIILSAKISKADGVVTKDELLAIKEKLNIPDSEIDNVSKVFNVAKQDIANINNIYALEGALYSKQLGIAGTVDCIAEYEDELAIIDFKTSKKPKPRDWIEHYFVQCMAYGCMLYELTGISVKKLVIIMSCENGECIVYEEYNKAKYIKLLGEYINKFVQDKLELYGTE